MPLSYERVIETEHCPPSPLFSFNIFRWESSPPVEFSKKKKERVIEHANLALILA